MEHTLIALCAIFPFLILPACTSSAPENIAQFVDKPLHDHPAHRDWKEQPENLPPVEDNKVGSNGRLSSVSALLYGEAYFQSFIKKYDKVYSGRQEYVHRLKIFKDNLIKALKNQALDPTANHGITPFSDLSEEEFQSQFLGLRAPVLLNAKNPAPNLPVDGLPSNFDWRERGAITDVKNQGTCGACWAFSTTGAVEGAYFISTGKLISLSEQQLVDCDRQCDPVEKSACDSGCKGGLMTNAYGYLMNAGGLMEENDYPYRAAIGQCEFDKKKVAAKVVNFTTISLDEDQIAANLVKYGPLAVGLNSAFMQTYVGGVSCPLICGKQFVNHGVLIVGYAERGLAPLRFGYRPYWTIKNSWGPHWGEKGYYKLCRGHGMCGVNTMVSAVAATVVAATDALKC